MSARHENKEAATRNDDDDCGFELLKGLGIE